MRPARAQTPAPAEPILRQVCALYGVTEAQLRSPSRLPECCEARWLAMALLCRRGWPPVQLSRLFARNHSTIVYGLVRAGVQRPTPHLARRAYPVGPAPGVVALLAELSR